MEKEVKKKKPTNMKLLVILGFVVLLPISWYKMYSDSEVLQKRYDNYLAVAREKGDMGIVKTSSSNYYAALKMNESYELRLELATMYLNNGETGKYRSACEDIISEYPYNPIAYEKLAESYYKDKQYTSVYQLSDTLNKRRVQSELISGYCEELKYEYSVKDITASTVITGLNGYMLCHSEKTGWYYLSLDGKKKICKGYQAISPFNKDGFAGVATTANTGYIIDKSNEKLYQDPEKRNITYVGYVSNGKVQVKLDEKYYASDLDFNLSENSYDFISHFNNERAAARLGDQWFFINPKGERISDNVYEEIVLDERGIPYVGKRNFVKKNGSYYMVDIDDTMVGTQTYEEATAFVLTEPAAVKINGNWGFVNQNGEIVIEPQYQEAKSFSNGCAGVKVDGTWSYINANNEIAVTGEFEEVGDFTEKYTAPVKIGGNWKIISLIKYNHK